MAGAGLFQGMAARQEARAERRAARQGRIYGVRPDWSATTFGIQGGADYRQDAQIRQGSQSSPMFEKPLTPSGTARNLNSPNTPNTGATSTTPQNATLQHENKLTPTPINVQIPGQTGTYPLTAFNNSTGEIVCYGPNSQGTNAHIADHLNSKLYTESVRTQAGDDILRYDTKKVVNIRPSDNPKADYTLPVTQYTRTLSDGSVLTFYGAAPGGVNQHIADKLNTALLFKQIEQDAAKQTNTGQQAQAGAATPNPTTKDEAQQPQTLNEANQINTGQAEKPNTENVMSTKKADPSNQMASVPTWPDDDTADAAVSNGQSKPTTATQKNTNKQPQAGAATPNPTTQDEAQQPEAEAATPNPATQDKPQQPQTLSEAAQASTSQKPQARAANPNPATKKSAVQKTQSSPEKPTPKKNDFKAIAERSDRIFQDDARNAQRPNVIDQATNMVQKGMETTKQIAKVGEKVITTVKKSINTVEEVKDTVGSLRNRQTWAGRQPSERIRRAIYDASTIPVRIPNIFNSKKFF